MSVLVLAGTAEARGVLERCADLPVIASLAGVTRKPKPLGVQTRLGGFGGDAGFERYLTQHHIRAVLDATHPFATVGHRTQRICAARGLPYLRLTRPPWRATAGDDWRRVPNLNAAREALPRHSTVFLGTGAGSEAVFAGLQDCTLWLRRVDDPGHPPPWPKGGYVIGLPSPSAEEERAVFEKHTIELVVAKDSGGPHGFGKLEAARAMGLPVIMVDRLAPPPGKTTTDLEAALEWIKTHAL